MADPATPELVAKAKRVVGMFVAMLGSGMALESPAVGTGLVIVLVGVGLMVWGLIQVAPSRSWVARGQESDPAAASHAPESAP